MNQLTDRVEKETVILLHGLAKTDYCMRKIAMSLDKIGYQVINSRYHSFKLPIEMIADNTIDEALELVENGNTIHFVTHSMGGILVRLYLQNKTINHLGRVVMLGPPNKGSRLIDILQKILTHPDIKSTSGMQLSTTESSLPNRLGKATFELGIIAGKRTVNPILSLLLEGENDGKVSVESTKLEGMKAHLVMPVTHPFMMRNNRVIEQVQHFLVNGVFA